MVEMPDNGPEARNDQRAGRQQPPTAAFTCRCLRGVTPHALEAFDPVEQTLVTGSRDATTVPAQALYLLNSSFVRAAIADSRRGSCREHNCQTT